MGRINRLGDLDWGASKLGESNWGNGPIGSDLVKADTRSHYMNFGMFVAICNLNLVSDPS